MTETSSIPDIARSAYAFLKAGFDRDLNILAKQTTDAMGLKGNCHVDFGTGIVTREVPDIQPTEDHQVVGQIETAAP